MAAPTLGRSLAVLGVAIVANAARRAAATVAGYLVAGGLMATSVAFLTCAGYRSIAQALGAVTAALITGSAYFVLSLIALLLLQLRRR
jgi:Na+/pantothenate symporter